MRTRDVNKEELIRAKAIEMIVKEGMDGFSMQKLAKAAGVSPATLYIYYKDRDDLILKLCLAIAHESMQESLAGFDPEASFAEGLKKQWENRLNFFLKHPVEMEFTEKMRYTNVYNKVRQMLVNSFSEVMGKFVTNAIERGELKPLPFEVFWSVAYAPLYQLIKFHTQGWSYGNDRFTLTDEVMHQTLQLVLKALKP